MNRHIAAATRVPGKRPMLPFFLTTSRWGDAGEEIWRLLAVRSLELAAGPR